MSEKKENPYLNHNLQGLLSVRDLFGRVLDRAQQKCKHTRDSEDLTSTIQELEESIRDIDEAIKIKKTEPES